MTNFLSDILKKLISTLLFATIMFVASYCLMTGEFPPKIENMKRGVHNLQAQVQQITKMREAQLNQAGKMSEAQPEQAELKYQQALLQKIQELEARIARLEQKGQ